jgi:hypothetical protein
MIEAILLLVSFSRNTFAPCGGGRGQLSSMLSHPPQVLLANRHRKPPLAVSWPSKQFLIRQQHLGLRVSSNQHHHHHHKIGFDKGLSADKKTSTFVPPTSTTHLDKHSTLLTTTRLLFPPRQQRRPSPSLLHTEDMLHLPFPSHCTVQSLILQL